ncbi:hypothetical protein Tco_1068561 [Tanacetum coccineum]|uniref:Uncharacterized protein n=1 Tax=Tanacetum coccineum TaxID=301880 RepID=A0ABQ5HG86_9ASTR
MRILSVVLEITPNLATRAIEIPLSSPYGTIWYLFDPTPFGWCKTDAHSMNFGLRTSSRQFILHQGPRNFNEASNTWKGKPNFNWAHAQTFTSPQNGSLSTYSSNYQTKLEKALIDFDSHQEKRLSSLRTQLGQHWIRRIEAPGYGVLVELTDKTEGFLSSVLLWLVIIVAVVGVDVMVVVVVESSSVVKLLFVIT